MFQKVKIFLKKDTVSFLFSENYFASLDYEGRLFVAFIEGKTYKRGLTIHFFVLRFMKVSFYRQRNLKILLIGYILILTKY